MLWSAEFIEARDAERIGLVNRVYPDDELMRETLAFATRVAQGAPLAVQLIKRVVRLGLGKDLATGLELAAANMPVVRSSEDHLEALSAFKERRPPVFKGKQRRGLGDWRLADHTRRHPWARCRGIIVSEKGNQDMSDLLPEEIPTIRDSIRRFMQTEVQPVMDQWEARGELPRDLVRKAGDAGFWGSLFPESVGGTAAGFLAAAVILEEIARADIRFRRLLEPAIGIMSDRHISRRHPRAGP